MLNPANATCISQVKSMTHWIKVLPKREGFLKTIVYEGTKSGVGASRIRILNV